MLFCGQIEFEDESWLSVRREDVYKASEELPLKVQQRLVSKEQSWRLLAPASIIMKKLSWNETDSRYQWKERNERKTNSITILETTSI